MFKMILLFLAIILVIYLVSNIRSLLLLNMQINFSFKSVLNSIKLNSSLLGFFGVEHVYNNNLKNEELKAICNDYLNDYDEKIIFIKETDRSSDLFIDQFDFTYLFEIFTEFSSIYIWLFFLLIFYCIIIYILHSILGLYSVYVDYFQKNPDHVESFRGFLPMLFIFYFFIFVFFGFFYFCFLVYFYYLLWLLFI
jgi:hypothetical protein